MRNPAWNREELILALDLYFQLEYGQMDGRNPQVKELSNILTLMNKPEGFSRSVNSISLKLANFKRIDPDFKGKGMIGGGKLEQVIWDRYANNKQLLYDSAEEIRRKIKIYVNDNSSISAKIVNDSISLQKAESEHLIITKTEGEKKVIVSNTYEKHPELRALALKIHGCTCMICGFNFEKFYGEWGKEFAEVHHMIPLFEYSEEHETDPEKDLIVLCANCHKMIHRKKGMTLTPEELKQKIKQIITYEQ